MTAVPVVVILEDINPTILANRGLSAMSKTAFLLTLLAAPLVGLLPAAPAQAQSIRTFVSTAGTDNPSCSLASPCRHFSAAVAATAVGGEVDALDPGAYGSFTIGQAITIEGQGWSYVAPPANGAAITISANPGDKINIRGVSLNGIGIANSIGIRFNTGTTLNVQNSVIRNFTDGIDFFPNASGPSQLFVSNTLISDNSAGGIAILLVTTTTMTGILDHVELENNAVHGLFANAASGTIDITVSDSVSANNGQNGIFAESISGASATVTVGNSTIANNGGNGLEASGTNALIRVTRSKIIANNTGWTAVGAGVVLSYADNNIDGNTSANTEPPNPLAYH
jgi:hypothetical protein